MYYLLLYYITPNRAVVAERSKGAIFTQVLDRSRMGSNPNNAIWIRICKVSKVRTEAMNTKARSWIAIILQLELWTQIFVGEDSGSKQVLYLMYLSWQ
jgi:hypothetical protein